MQKPTTAQDHSYLVYHFEMGSVDHGYSNITVSNADEISTGIFTNSSKLHDGSEIIAPPSDGTYDYPAAIPRRETALCKSIGVVEKDARENTRDQSNQLYSAPYVLDHQCDSTVFPSRAKDKKPHSFVKKSHNTQVIVNLADSQKLFTEPEKKQEERCKREVEGGLSTPRFKFPIMAFLHVLTFFLAAVGLTLAIMITNGKITCSRDSPKDAAKTQRLVDFPTKFQELKENISQLKKELDNARQELKEFIEIKNLSQQGKTLNLTSQVFHSGDNEDFELMLNSSQQKWMTMITDIWVQVNNTGKELRRETSLFRATGNLTQENIQKVNNSLISLKDEVHSEERRINETVLLTVQHHDQMKFFEKLINSSRRYLVTEVTEMWSSINSTQKDLQQQTKAFWSSVWAAVNATKMELMQKVNNISKMAGTKGSGNFSRCKYEVKTGTTTTGGSDADATVVEPAGYRILGVTCSTNFAAQHNLVSKDQKYICNCKGDSGKFRPLGNELKKCNLHYWFCPIN
ncbi:uncharacterized protein [Montipora foliosa]|uniref:uncharacterized protein isoform X1 n=1 Tax=Montipora foliosa TaxID=591990 RepID=UPI0035F135F0